MRAPKGWGMGRGVPSPRGEIFSVHVYAEMVRFSADLITGTGLVAHCREHYLWLSLENWLKLSAEILTEIRVNQMTRCHLWQFQCSLLPNNFGLYYYLPGLCYIIKRRCFSETMLPTEIVFNRIMMQTMPPFTK